MVNLYPYSNPFDTVSIAISIVTFIVHIIFLLALGFYSYRTYKIMVGNNEKAKMMFISTAFFSLGIADIFYFLSFLVLVLAGSTRYRVEINDTVIYPYGIFEALFRSLAIVFLISMIAYSRFHLKGQLTKRETLILAFISAIRILCKAFHTITLDSELKGKLFSLGLLMIFLSL